MPGGYYFYNCKQRSQLVAPDIQLTTHQEEKIEEIINQLVVQHKPLQYIMGEVPFIDTHIVVKPPVLIPRPETEEWTAWLIDQLAPIKQEPLTILDMCTGSGCMLSRLQKLSHRQLSMLLIMLIMPLRVREKIFNIIICRIDTH